MTREQGTENREQGTENREQRTENREQGTGYREQGTENREQGTGYREQGTGFRQLYFSLLMSVFFRLPTYLGFFGLSTSFLPNSVNITVLKNLLLSFSCKT